MAIKSGYVPRMPSSEGRNVDWSKAVPAPDMPKLKFSTAVMNLRVPQSLLDGLKMEANKRDVPYQSLVKMLLSDSLERMRKRAA